MKASKWFWDSDLTFWGNFLVWCVSVLFAVILVLAVATQIPLFTFPCWVIGVRYCLCLLRQGVSKWQESGFWGCAENVAYNMKVPVMIFAAYCCAIVLFGFRSGTDTDSQWNQALCGYFSDWHPIMHTFFFWAVSKVVKSQYGVWVLQTVLLSLLGGWLNQTLKRLGVGRKTSRLVFFLTVMSPVTVIAFLSILKDAAFALAALALVLALVNVECSRGEWFVKMRNKVLFALFVLFAAFLRHNGFFFAFSGALAALLLCKRKVVWHGILSFSLSAVLCLGYVVLRCELTERGIVKPTVSQRYIEAIGVPIAMIGNVMVNNPNRLSEKELAFCEKLSPMSDWRMYFKGSGNSIKERINFKYLVEEVPPREFLHMLMSIVREDPKDAIKGFISITGIGWNPIPEHVPGKILNGARDSVMRTFDLYALCNLLFHQPLGWILASPGFAFCAVLIAGVFGWLRFGFSRFMLAMPILAYNIGTALLMYDSGSSDFRFFYAVEMTYPLLILGCLWPLQNALCSVDGNKTGL